MNIGGLQKNSLIDFPGRVCAVVFTQGCNFCCPYCHNPSLFAAGPTHNNASNKLTPEHFVKNSARQAPAYIAELEVLDFLMRRKGLLDGVVISGGEPCLQPDLIDFCRHLKSMGYDLKLDTNGSYPQVLNELVEAKLIDYVAMDLKANPAHYPPELCRQPLASLKEAISQSATILNQSGVEYEFRTTCAAPFINDASITAIAKFIAEHAKVSANSPHNTKQADIPLFLQKPDYRAVLNSQFYINQTPPDDAKMLAWRDIALKYISYCELR